MGKYTCLWTNNEVKYSFFFTRIQLQFGAHLVVKCISSTTPYNYLSLSGTLPKKEAEEQKLSNSRKSVLVMNNPNSSARDRLFLVRPDQYEELLFADDSADDDEILDLDEEDAAFLEQDENELVQDENGVEFAEVIIESAKTPPPSRKRCTVGQIALDRQIAEAIASNSSEAAAESTTYEAAAEEPIAAAPALSVPPEITFNFQTTATYTQPKFSGIDMQYPFEFSKVLQPDVHNQDEMPSVYEVFDAVCHFEGMFKYRLLF